ncbi:lantibiotic dehydratase [Streptomyces sudanensis]|uniref:lantibiotic dehydratase n=1 Tax=Streptomyces sudanensis TaxID=436397 RepID=UPI0020CF6505|nr:lantibiotic dehydratase [Streptomyces sudanensis]MCP9957424.1 lantibiotic dehydratase [Streptomyces sudanensis]MCQ0002028.1 lantibiotic dehydratase [Streptomyces sudanensis]
MEIRTEVEGSMGKHRRVYQSTNAVLLRAAVIPLTGLPSWWPEPHDTDAARTWISEVWAQPAFSAAIRQASSALAARLDAVCDGQPVPPRQIRRAYLSTAAYVLRATGRPTPFGLFAGIAPARIGSEPQLRWGDAHRAVVRADTEWLEDIVGSLEAVPELRERLRVVVSSLAMPRGGRLHVQHGGPNGAAVRRSTVVRMIEVHAARPVGVRALLAVLRRAFPDADPAGAHTLIASLIARKVLVTNLRAPMTETDPLGHLIRELRAVGADDLPAVASILDGLVAVQQMVWKHNEAPAGAQRVLREVAVRRCRDLSAAARCPLAVDLVLDAAVQVPNSVVRQMERAADVLLRLTRQPNGQGVWQDYYAAFWERYGSGTLVPLKDVVDPAAGLGYPALYPGSRRTAPKPSASERDARLLTLAWGAVAAGERELILTDELIEHIAGEPVGSGEAPPSVEMCARIHARDLAALARSEFTITVTPARSAGTLTSRFTAAATGSGLEEVYRRIPASVQGALTAQMSFPGLYAHIENVARIPAHLPRVIPLGEHRAADGKTEVIDVDDLAVTVASGRLHLVSLSRRQVIEPQVFHAMALDKQPPILARFLAHLSRAFGPAWTGFDWGPHAERLPFLPRVRYDKTILAPARWHLSAGDLPGPEVTPAQWSDALDSWRTTWQCQGPVELRDDDRVLRLALDVPAHAAILRERLDREGRAVLTEAPPEDCFGWIGSRVHEVAVPMVSTRPPAPNPLTGHLPVQRNRTLGSPPAAPDAAWVTVHLYTHPELHDELITEHMAPFASSLPDHPDWWYIRYRSPNEPDHIRLRIRTASAVQRHTYTEAIGAWTARLRDSGMIGDVVFTSYTPETGRYGTGAALVRAETVFVTDSQVAATQLALPAAGAGGQVLTAVGLIDIARGMLGPKDGLRWLAGRPMAAVADRTVTEQVIRLARAQAPAARGWSGTLAEAWHRRGDALVSYRDHVGDGMDLDMVLESLLHMHYNRMRGISRDDEKTCRRAARQAAVACLAWTGTDR